MSGVVVEGSSAYGAGAPIYENAELQKALIQGRIEVAIGIRDRAKASGDAMRAYRWSRIVDELLEKLLEVRGL